VRKIKKGKAQAAKSRRGFGRRLPMQCDVCRGLGPRTVAVADCVDGPYVGIVHRGRCEARFHESHHRERAVMAVDLLATFG
jgi:hypothetical protein